MMRSIALKNINFKKLY